MMQQNQKVLQENQTVQLEQNQCLLADFEQMDLLDLHLLAQLQKRCLLADYELQKKCLLADYEQMDLHLQLQKKCLLTDHKHHDSLLDLYMFHYMYRFQELNSTPGSPIARGGAGARYWCGQ